MNREHNCNLKLTCLAEYSNDNQGHENNDLMASKIVSTIHENLVPHVLFIEPFYGGSHKQLLDLLVKYTRHTLVTLKAKKWPWRARCGALVLSELIPPITTETVLFCSSVLSLAELLGLRPDLLPLKKIVYFHENQFVYPIREIKERDIQFAYNQITTCLSADLIIFNSKFNAESLIKNLDKVIKLLPDYRPKNLKDKIKNKSEVLYFPIQFPSTILKTRSNTLTIVWPHRWEFDKNPEMFLQTMLKLNSDGYKFHVHILGEVFQDVPAIFKEAKNKLGEVILTYGLVESKEEYFKILQSCHVAVSTARHEFFGVSMLEAVYCGCFPLVPDDLVYPEIYPDICLYKDDLLKRLQEFCNNPQLADDEQEKLNINFNLYSADNLIPCYLNLISK